MICLSILLHVTYIAVIKFTTHQQRKFILQLITFWLLQRQSYGGSTIMQLMTKFSFLHIKKALSHHTLLNPKKLSCTTNTTMIYSTQEASGIAEGIQNMVSLSTACL
ncbi:unnamed protein product [Musa acuminata subsp. burmannicoides]